MSGHYNLVINRMMRGTALVLTPYTADDSPVRFGRLGCGLRCFFFLAMLQNF